MCIWFTFILDSWVPLATQLCNCSWIGVGGLKRSDVDCCVAVCNFPRLTAGFWICVRLQHLTYNLCPNLVPCNDAVRLSQGLCFLLGPTRKWSLPPLSKKQQVALSSLFRRLSPTRHGVDAVPSATLNHILLLTHTQPRQALIRWLDSSFVWQLWTLLCVLAADAVTHPRVRWPHSVNKDILTASWIFAAAS